MQVKLFFYFFASIALLAALGVILSKHLVKSMLCLLLLFISTAILWLLIKAELLALLLALIYIGAVLVLFLFVIMIFDLQIQRRKFDWFLLAGIASSAGLAAILIDTCTGLGFYHKHVFAFTKQTRDNSIVDLANLLFTHYLTAFEMIGLLLLAAIVSVIGLSEKGSKR